MLSAEKRAFFQGLYGICGPVGGRSSDDRVAETVQWAERLLAGGARVVQLRDKESDGRTLLEAARRLRALTRQASALFIVNDRLDIALMAEADGVHVGQDDLPVAAVRKVAAQCGREDLIVGLSTHDLAQVSEARELGADYIGFGPIHTTATKKDALSPRGTGLLKEAVELAGKMLPIVAIGGIGLPSLDPVVSTGVAMAAVIGDILQAPDPVARAAAIHGAFRR
jgi:thiamine-phosphate pyrophosphorylase